MNNFLPIEVTVTIHEAKYILTKAIAEHQDQIRDSIIRRVNKFFETSDIDEIVCTQVDKVMRVIIESSVRNSVRAVAREISLIKTNSMIAELNKQYGTQVPEITYLAEFDADNEL